MNLENLNVQELSLEEQMKIDGGAIGCLVVGAVIVCAMAAGVAVGYYVNKK